MRDESLAADLLTWYDRNARVMPWRIGPAERAAGVRPDPYRIWLSEVMLQQTTVAAVRAYFLRFTARWPDVTALAAAADADVMGEWAGLGYYARARNLLACARAVAAEHGGRFPTTRDGLMGLPGIGPYTAAAIAAIAFDEAAVVVDGNVERVMARLYGVQTPLPAAKPDLVRLAAGLTPALRAGDYAQAVMDLGATICTPRNPACGICPWTGACMARAAGVQTELPRKTTKPAKPVREGRLWIARRTDGAMLLETRPERGLLGGKVGLQRPRSQQVVKDRLRIQGSMRQLDALMLARRPPLSDLLAVRMGHFLTGPFDRTPGRIIKPLFLKFTERTRLMVALQAHLGLGHHPQAIVRKRPVANDIT